MIVEISKNIDELAAADALDGTEVQEVLQGGINKYVGTALLNAPSLTQAQIDLLTPVNGMFCYNTDTDVFQGVQAGVWVSFDTTAI